MNIRLHNLTVSVFHTIVLALIGLTIGTLVYLTARPSTTYVAMLFQGLPFPQLKSGLITGSLPTFCHVFAFSLISGELLRPWVRVAGANFIVWDFLETAVEIGQIEPLALAIQSMLKSSWGGTFSDLVGEYFVRSTFDYFDLMACSLGSIVAWIVHTTAERKQDE